MRERVLDASVLMKWFEPGANEASRLRAEFEAGDLTVLAPPLILLEVLNVAGRAWSWTESELADLAAGLEDLPLAIVEPPLAAVADWVARGVTAYDAAYLAVAQATGAALVTDDAVILAAAPALTEPLG
jgi:predicted nucleic acid-binding protein